MTRPNHPTLSFFLKIFEHKLKIKNADRKFENLTFINFFELTNYFFKLLKSIFTVEIIFKMKKFHLCLDLRYSKRTC